jgi:hypothetical protein
VVKAWKAWVNATVLWLMPLQVDSAVVVPGQPPLSRPSGQSHSGTCEYPDAKYDPVHLGPRVNDMVVAPLSL